MTDQLRILIVEDEAIIAESLRFSLEDLGFIVVSTCYTYNEAQQLLGTEQIDLVLLDINLGDKNESNNGFALARSINETSGPPFIFITAYNDKETITAASKLHPYGYLIKPVNNALLFATIQLAIERCNNNVVASAPDNEQQKPEFFYVKIGARTKKMLWQDVFSIEAGKNYVIVRCNSANQSFPIRGSLLYIMDNLLPDHLHDEFIKVNRSQYLNKKYITGFDSNFVYCDQEKFENSKNAIKQLKEISIK